MDPGTSFRATPQLVLGAIVVVLGVLFTLDNLGILEAENMLRFWPAAFMVLGLVKIVNSYGAPGRVAGFTLFLAGTVILLNNLHLLRFEIWELWPLILVFVGAHLVWAAFGRKASSSVDEHSTITAIAFMAGIDRNYNSQDFRGGELTAIMGGCEIDMREAAMQVDEAVIHTFAFWGGIEIKVPEDWTVTSKGLPLMGGFEEKTRAPKGGPRPQKHLIIKGIAIMGGVEVHN